MHTCIHTYIHIHRYLSVYIYIYIIYIYIYNFLCLFTPLGMKRGHIPEPQVMAASTGSEVTQALNRFITVLVVPWWIPGSW